MVVCTYEVDGRENFHPVKRQDIVMGVWQRVSDRNGDRIQGMLITTTPPVSAY